jgi:hypothetical protein
MQILCINVCKCKNIPVETIPGMGRIKESGGGVNLSMIYLIHCKNFYKYHNVPPYNTTIKRSQQKENKLFNNSLKESFTRIKWDLSLG